MLRKLTFSAILLSFALAAWANDTTATLGAGGLVPLKTSEIVLDEEVLNISVHQVKILYTFRNISSHDIDAIVAFPLPDVDGGNVENVPMVIPSSNPVNFVGFEVYQLTPIGQARSSGPVRYDRHAISAETELRAFHDDQEITEELKRLQLPISVLDPQMNAALASLAPKERDALLKQDIIGYTDGSGPNHPGRYWPWWTTRVQFYWRQHFPAASVTMLEQSYSPVVGGGYIEQGGGETLRLSPYCVTPEMHAHITEIVAQSPKKEAGTAVLLERQIEYILTTANNWNGPIRTFDLSIQTDSPDDIVLTCMSGLKRSSPTEYRLERTNFKPQRDLDLLILQNNPELK